MGWLNINKRIIKKSFVLFVVLLFLFSFPVEFSKADIVAPTQASFGTYDSFGSVDLHTGDMGLSIPLMTVPGRGGMIYPITLGYSAGIQVQSLASWVGLGWNLGPSMISRSVRGVPDDYKGTGESDNIYMYDKSSWIDVNVNQIPISETVHNWWGAAVSIASLALMVFPPTAPIAGTLGGGLSQVISAGTMTTTAGNLGMALSAGSSLFSISQSITGQEIQTGFRTEYEVLYFDNTFKSRNVRGFINSLIGGNNNVDSMDSITPDNFFASTPVYSGPLIYGDLNIVENNRLAPKLHTKQLSNILDESYSDDAIDIDYHMTNDGNIDSFKITSVDGTRYTFEDRIFETVEGDFDLNDGEIVNDGDDGIERGATLSVSTKNPNPNGDCHLRENERGDFNYLERVEVDGYTLNWGLSEIKDSNGDNYITFGYTDPNERKKINPNPATGEDCIETPDGTMSYSEMNYNYKNLDYIKSDTHIAYFHLGEREDEHAAQGRPSYFLKAITLHSLNERDEAENPALSTVYFKYNYNLMPGYPDNEDHEDNFGRLTLEKIYFLGEDPNLNIDAGNFNIDAYCENNQDNCLPPYEFEYGFNPEWGIKKFDRWGYYYENGVTLSHNSNGFPVGLRPDAWSLTRINLPEGGFVEWEYESDRYNYINNMKINPVDQDDFGLKYGGGIRVRSVRKCINDNNCIIKFYAYRDGVTPSEPGTYEYKQTSVIGGGAYSSPIVEYGYVRETVGEDDGYTLSEFTTALTNPNTGYNEPVILVKSNNEHNENFYGFFGGTFNSRKITIPEKGIMVGPAGHSINLILALRGTDEGYNRLTEGRVRIVYLPLFLPNEDKCNLPPGYSCVQYDITSDRMFGYSPHPSVSPARDNPFSYQRDNPCNENIRGGGFCPLLFDTSVINDNDNQHGNSYDYERVADLSFYIEGWDLNKYIWMWNDYNGFQNWFYTRDKAPKCFRENGECVPSPHPSFYMEGQTWNGYEWVGGRELCQTLDNYGSCGETRGCKWDYDLGCIRDTYSYRNLSMWDIRTEAGCQLQGDRCEWTTYRGRTFCSCPNYIPVCSVYPVKDCNLFERDSSLDCNDMNSNGFCDLIEDWGDISNDEKYSGTSDNSYMQGVLKKTMVYNNDNELVASAEYNFDFSRYSINEINHFPAASWSRLVSKSEMLDGVTTVSETEYNERNGLPILNTLTNSEGQLITQIKYAGFEDDQLDSHDDLKEAHKWDRIYWTEQEDENGNLLSYSENCYLSDDFNEYNRLGAVATCIDPTNHCAERDSMKFEETEISNCGDYSDEKRDQVILTRFLEYNRFGNLIEKLDDENKMYTFYYGNNDNRINNDAQRESPNHKAYLTAVEDPLGNTVQAEYNRRGQVEKIYDVNNQFTSYDYDAFSRLSSLFKPGDEVPSAEYEYYYGRDENLDYNFIQVKQNNDDYETISRSFSDGLGRNIQTQTRKNNRLTNWIVSGTSEYEEGTGRLIKTYKSIDIDTDGVYQSPSDLRGFWNRIFNIELPYTKTEFYNDPLGRIKRIYPPDDNNLGYDSDSQVQTEYGNEDGNYFKTTVTDPEGRTTQSYTDKFGNLVKLIDAEAQEWNYLYDILGRLLEIEDPTNREERKIKTEYDALGRIKSTSHPDTGITDSYDYDNNNNILFFSTNKGRYKFTYDALNRKLTDEFSSNPDEADDGNYNIRIRYYYDGNDGDDKDCLSNNAYPTGKLCSVFKGDELGEDLTTATSYGRFGYDARGRLVEEQVSIKKEDEFLDYIITYNYDNLNNLKEERISGGDIEGDYMIAYRYNELNQLIDVEFRKGDEETTIASGFNYNPTGTIERFTQNPEGEDPVETIYEYTPRDWLETLNINIPDMQNDLLEGDQEPFQRGYEYDKLGNLRYLSNANGRLAEYQYDSLDRLENVVNSDYYPTTYEFRYDEVGNRQTQINGQNAINYIYNNINNNRLTYITEEGRDSTTNINYDEAGNAETITTNEGTNKYIYDYFNNMMKEVDLGDDGQIDEEYVYDSSNRRIKKTEGEDKTTYYLYDQFGNLVYELCEGEGCTPVEFDEEGNKFVIQNYRGINVTHIYEDGIMFIKGILKKGEEFRQPDSNDFIIKNARDEAVAWIDDTTGNLYLKGQLYEHTEEQPSQDKNEFIIQNLRGENIAWFDDQGNLYLIRSLFEEYNDFNQ
jgi:YD repeat-containing protein